MINIATGIKEIPVKRDGVEVGALMLDTGDIRVARKVATLSIEIETKKQEMLQKLSENDSDSQMFEVLEETVNYFKSKIDEIWGVGTSELMFGSACNLEMFKSFFDSVIPFYTKASNERIKKYAK